MPAQVSAPGGRRDSPSARAVRNHALCGDRQHSGDVFVFIGKTCKRTKVLWWDGTGLCILCKRMDKGRFIAPWKSPGDGPLEMSRTELRLLLEGSTLVGKVKLSPDVWVPGTA